MKEIEASQPQNRLSQRQIFFLIILSSFVYWSVRWHPISYDISRHIELLTGRAGELSAIISPKITPLKFLNYGILCLFAPLPPMQSLFLLLGLGWISFMLFFFASVLQTQRFLGSIWIGAVFAFLITIWGPRHTLLFANHPYEIGLHFSLAGYLFSLSRWPGLSLGLNSLALMIHPNLILVSMVGHALNSLINKKYSFPCALAFLGSLAFYLVTAK